MDTRQIVTNYHNAWTSGDMEFGESFWLSWKPNHRIRENAACTPHWLIFVLKKNQ